MRLILIFCPLGYFCWTRSVELSSTLSCDNSFSINLRISLSAETKLLPQSEIISCGLEFRMHMNRIRDFKKLLVSKLCTTSIWHALEAAQVNKQIQRFTLDLPIFTKNGPHKSQEVQ